MFCKTFCAPQDPTTDTVRVNILSTVQAEADPGNITESVTRYCDQGEQRRHQQTYHLTRNVSQDHATGGELRLPLPKELDAEEAVHQNDEQQQEWETGYALQEEQELQQEVKVWRARLETERAESARRAEAKRLAEEQQRRKTALDAFLVEHGFTGVGIAKRTMMKTTYPIHVAAEIGNAEITEMLLKEGANPMQKNSAGKTAAQVAKRNDRDGSHAGVLLLLGGMPRPNAGGA